MKSGSIRATKFIVNFSKTFGDATLLLRDINGCTPLHCAVHAGFAKITEILSTEVPPLALHMEDGVGDTLLELASVKLTQERITELKNQRLGNPPTLNVSAVHATSFSPGDNATHLESELLRLRATTKQLTQEGLLIKGTNVADELVKFADMMDIKLEEAKAAEATKARAAEAVKAASGGANHGTAQPMFVLPTFLKSTPTLGRISNDNSKNPRDFVARSRTLDVVSKAVSAAPGRRQLVRLLDVQKSIQSDLTRHAKARYPNRASDEDELQFDEDGEGKERAGSLIVKHIGIARETF